MHTGSWRENLREGDKFEDRGTREDNVKMDIQEVKWGT